MLRVRIDYVIRGRTRFWMTRRSLIQGFNLRGIIVMSRVRSNREVIYPSQRFHALQTCLATYTDNSCRALFRIFLAPIERDAPHSSCID